jgi:hypothetical protein
MMSAGRTTKGESKRKSEVVTVRLDPQLKYLAELAARRQRRPLSSYIEWAVEESLSRVYPAYDPSTSSDTLKDVANALWDVDETDRFVKLALHYPDLLGHEEQRLWKLIRECGFLWRGNYRSPEGEWQWTVRESSLIWGELREHWDTFRKVARGELHQSALPSWERRKPKSEVDDEIPF